MSKLFEQINKERMETTLGKIAFYVNEKIDISDVSLGDYISTENMVSNRGGVVLANKLPKGKVTKFKNGDVLTSNIRPYFKKIWFASKEGGASNDVLVIRPKNETELDNLYLYHILSNDLFFSYSVASSHGTKMPRGDKDAIIQYKITLPPLSVQKKIASILGAYDEKIENNNKIIKNLEETAQTIFNEWFVNFKFPGYEKVKMVDSEMGEIPEGWVVSCVRDVSKNHDNKRIPLSSMERQQKKGIIPYYGANGILDYVNEIIFSGEYILFAEDGTVKNNKNEPIIYLVNDNFWVNNHAHIISGEKVSNYFLYISLKKINIDPYITGGVQPKITQQNLNSIPVLIPDSKTLNHFYKISEPIKEQINQIKKENISLKSQRDLLLNKLI